MAGWFGLHGTLERIYRAHPPREAWLEMVDHQVRPGLHGAVEAVAEETVRQGLEAIQHDLFALGAILATAPADGSRPEPWTPDVPVGRIVEMEAWIDDATGELEELKDVGCTGAGALSSEVSDPINARTFAKAEKMGLPILTLCSTCQGVMSQANLRRKEDA